MAYRRKYGKRRYRGKRRVRKAKRSRAGPSKKHILSVIYNMSETKYKSLTAENEQLYHNVGRGAGLGYVAIASLLRSTDGTTQAGRIGDSVYAMRLSIKLWLATKADRPNVMFRIFIVAVPSNQAGISNPANLFKGFAGNKMIDNINTDVYSVVYHRIVKITHGDTSLEKGGVDPLADAQLHEVSKMVKINLRLNRKINYIVETGNGDVCKEKRDNLSLVIIPYDATGTLVTDNIASYSYHSMFYYKDL